MDPQAPNIPEPVTNTMPQSSTRVNNITILSVAIFILLSLSAVAFLYYQNQQLKSMLASYQTPVPTYSPTPVYTPIESASPSAAVNPIVTSPTANTKVSSPLIITGTVPSGWMFEGSFPIKIVDSTRTLVAQGTAKEVTPGSWTSGKPVKFSVTLPFSTTDNSGFLILYNDNPSGDSAKSKTFEVPVTF